MSIGILIQKQGENEYSASQNSSSSLRFVLNNFPIWCILIKNIMLLHVVNINLAYNPFVINYRPSFFITSKTVSPVSAYFLMTKTSKEFEANEEIIPLIIEASSTTADSLALNVSKPLRDLYQSKYSS